MPALALFLVSASQSDRCHSSLEQWFSWHDVGLPHVSASHHLPHQQTVHSPSTRACDVSVKITQLLKHTHISTHFVVRGQPREAQGALGRWSKWTPPGARRRHPPHEKNRCRQVLGSVPAHQAGDAPAPGGRRHRQASTRSTGCLSPTPGSSGQAGRGSRRSGLRAAQPSSG